MKRVACVIVPLWICIAGLAVADDFLGAPVPPGGTNISASGDRIERAYSLRPEEVLSFYQDRMKSEKDVKFRAREHQTYIEDHGDRPWHSITIAPAANNGTTVIIAKDNWTWILGTLVLRFIGVFIVLCILYAVMAVSGTAISRMLARESAAG